jgi:hypothetical protein
VELRVEAGRLDPGTAARIDEVLDQAGEKQARSDDMPDQAMVGRLDGVLRADRSDEVLERDRTGEAAR